MQQCGRKRHSEIKGERERDRRNKLSVLMNEWTKRKTTKKDNKNKLLTSKNDSNANKFQLTINRLIYLFLSLIFNVSPIYVFNRLCPNQFFSKMWGKTRFSKWNDYISKFILIYFVNLVNVNVCVCLFVLSAINNHNNNKNEKNYMPHLLIIDRFEWMYDVYVFYRCRIQLPYALV